MNAMTDKKQNIGSADDANEWRHNEIKKAEDGVYRWSDKESSIKLSPSSVINITEGRHQDMDYFTRMATND